MKTFEILNIQTATTVNYLVAAQLRLVLYSSFAGFNLQYTSGEWGGGLLTEELVDSGFLCCSIVKESLFTCGIYTSSIYIYTSKYMHRTWGLYEIWMRLI